MKHTRKLDGTKVPVIGELPPGDVRVVQDGQFSVTASWYAVPFNGDRGTVSLSSTDPGVWWVNRAIVQGPGGPGRVGPRRQGIGSTLLKLAIEKARGLGARMIMVSPGGYDMKPADQQRFYEKNGFVKTPTEHKGEFVWIWRA